MKAPEISDADKLKAAIEVRKNTIKINIIDLWKRVQVRMLCKSSYFNGTVWPDLYMQDLSLSLSSSSSPPLPPPSLSLSLSRSVCTRTWSYKCITLGAKELHAIMLIPMSTYMYNYYIYRECLHTKLRINTWSCWLSVPPLPRCSLRRSIPTRTSDSLETCGWPSIARVSRSIREELWHQSRHTHTKSKYIILWSSCHEVGRV